VTEHKILFVICYETQLLAHDTTYGKMVSNELRK